MTQQDRVAAGRRPSADSRLLRRPPRLIEGTFHPRAGETPVQFAVRAGLGLDRTTLAIQGPPGTGKTFTGGEMIAALVNAGRKVGVVANSHKVIVNLLEAALRAAPVHNAPLRVLRKPKDGDDVDAGAIRVEKSVAAIAAELGDGRATVVTTRGAEHSPNPDDGPA